VLQCILEQREKEYASHAKGARAKYKKHTGAAEAYAKKLHATVEDEVAHQAKYGDVSMEYVTSGLYMAQLRRYQVCGSCRFSLQL